MSQSPTSASLIAFAVYWGSDPTADDTATQHQFDSEDLHGAWWQGVNAADGWFEANFLDHPHFRVGRDGEMVSTLKKGQAEPARNPCEVHVLWGENPERGDTPDTHVLESPEQAQAFIEGVEATVGWMKYFVVPDESFRPYPGPEEALEALSGDARATFQAWV